MSPYQKAANAWNAGESRVRIVHPSFGYVEKLVAPRFSGGKMGAQFTRDRTDAATWNSIELRAAQDANNNGPMALLVASYGGLTLEPVE